MMDKFPSKKGLAFECPLYQEGIQGCVSEERATVLGRTPPIPKIIRVLALRPTPSCRRGRLLEQTGKSMNREICRTPRKTFKHTSLNPSLVRGRHSVLN